MDADAHKDAQRLLALHGGSCSVPLLSRLGRAFAVLEIAGEVSTCPSGTPGFVDAYAKNFASRFCLTGGKELAKVKK